MVTLTDIDVNTLCPTTHNFVEIGGERYNQDGYHVNKTTLHQIYKPDGYIILDATDYTYNYKMRLDDGTLISWQRTNRGYTCMLADRDEAIALKKITRTRVNMTLTDEELSNLKSKTRDLKNISVAQYRNHGTYHIIVYRTYRHITYLKVSFPPTERGLALAKIYSRHIDTQGRFNIYNKDLIDNAYIKKWKADRHDAKSATGHKYVFINKGYGSGGNYIVRMPLHPEHLEPRVSRCFSGQYGLELAIAWRDYVLDHHCDPGWVGNTIDNIKIYWADTKSKEKHIYAHKNKQKKEQYEVLVKVPYKDRCFETKKIYNTLQEAIKYRNLNHLLGISEINHFKPILIDFTAPIYHIPKETKRTYVSRDLQLQCHTELIDYIKKYNEFNKDKFWYSKYEKDDKIKYAPIPPHVIEAVYKICERMKYLPKHKSVFGELETKRDMMLWAFLQRRILWYNPAKGNPFTFITMVIDNCWSMYKNQIRLTYKNGTQYRFDKTYEYNEDYRTHNTIVDDIADDSDIEMDIDDNDTLSISQLATIIQMDIEGYKQLASDLGISFEDWLIMCKNNKKIIKEININTKEGT